MIKKLFDFNPGEIIDEKFIVLSKIGEGSFGKIYKIVYKNTGEILALKIQENSEIKSKNSLLKESKILFGLIDEIGFPRLKYFKRLEKISMLVITCLDKSLEEYFTLLDYSFSLDTVCKISLNLLSRLETLHNNFIIHQDLKPENFIFCAQDSLIYLIDFGLSKYFKNKKGYTPFQKNVGLVGTARYMSVNSHYGNSQSRRDDLISLGYILLYFYQGRLPWMGITEPDLKKKLKIIEKLKENINLREIILNISHYEVFSNYFRLKIN